MLSKDKVFPYVNTQRLKIDGIVKISSGIFQPTRSNIGTTSECIMDLSAVGLRKLVDFLVKRECRRIVPPFEVKAEILKRTGCKYKKDAWQDIAPCNDKFSEGKFREGWQAIVRIVHVDFLAKQAIARHEHEPLLLEARNAFTNTKAEWDKEKGELVREREALKEELNKAKEMAAEVEQCMKAIRLEKEALQQ
ncbi:hypothetical protein R1flu_017754 [Riccia fluitans]|uniref:Uncharacterized protein n=1 Tax=Riccia fluitans TaxID=41844 RepID=A0ABD1ZG78_9MARC